MASKINDIVEKTGVSVSTVSRILNGEKKYKYAEATVEKVKEAARQLGYRPNFFARSFKQGRTNCIGLLGNMGIANFSSPYITGVVSGVEKAMIADERGYSLLAFGGTNRLGVDETRDLIRKGLVDGLIFIIMSASLPEFDKTFLPLLTEYNVPFVVIHSLDTALPYHNVGVDMTRAGYLAAAYLLDKGHTRITLYDHEPGSTLLAQLKDGADRACAQKGADVNVLAAVPDESFFQRAYRTFMRIDRLPQAVIMPSDRSCLALTQAAANRGLRQPDACDVIRISDAPMLREMLPGLPYVPHPVAEKAATALTMLLDILEGKRDGSTVQQEILETGPIRI